MRKLVWLVLLLHFVVGFSQSPKCGNVFSKQETTRILNALNDNSYEYEGDDLDVQVDVSDIALNTAGDEVVVETFFFMKNKEEVGIMFAARFPKGLIDKIACNVFSADIKGLPENRYLVFIDEPTGAVMAMIKN